MTLVRKGPKKRDVIDNIRPITLLNTELKILAKVQSKSLTHVADGLVASAQGYAVPSRTIQGNLHFIQYTEAGLNEPGKEGVVVHLDQIKYSIGLTTSTWRPCSCV